jgi:hypothetical protein
VKSVAHPLSNRIKPNSLILVMADLRESHDVAVDLSGDVDGFDCIKISYPQVE